MFIVYSCVIFIYINAFTNVISGTIIHLCHLSLVISDFQAVLNDLCISFI